MVLFGTLSCSPTSSTRLHLHNEINLALAKSTMKHRQKSELKIKWSVYDLVYGYWKCMFVDFLIGHTYVCPIMFIVELWSPL